MRTTAQTVFALLGFAFLGWSLVTALQDPDLTVLPGLPSLALAVLFVVAGLWAAVLGWSRLLGLPPRRDVARGFLVAQLGKYMPGGVWQAVGQVTHAASATPGGGPRAASAFVTSVITQVTAGLTVGTVLVLAPSAPSWARLSVPLAAAFSIALLVRPGWMVRVISLVPPLRRRLDPSTALPTRSQLLASWGWGVVTMTLAGGVFVLAYAAPAGTVLVEAAPAYALAWTIGFLAVPFPAGLGIREAALVILLPGGDTTAIVAAAAIVRIIYIVGEVIAIATTVGRTTVGTREDQPPADRPTAW